MSECQTLLLIEGFRDANYVSILREISPEIESSAQGDLQSENLPDVQTVIFVGEPVIAGGSAALVATGEVEMAITVVPFAAMAFRDLAGNNGRRFGV